MTGCKKVRGLRKGIRFAYVEHPEGFHIDTVNGVLPGNGEVKIADGESFFDVLSTTNYIILMAACILMTAYFIYRMHAYISLPLGQRSACKPLGDDLAEE